MIDSKQLIEDAAALGLTTEVVNGNRCVYGQIGNVLKLYAAQGLDVIKDHDGRLVTSWVVTRGALIGNDVQALILLDKTTGYAYGRSCNAR